MKRYIPIVAPLLAAFLLTSCIDFNALSAQAIQKKREYSDAEGELFRNAPCAMTVGAFVRNLDRDEQLAVLALCGMTPEEAIGVVTVE